MDSLRTIALCKVAGGLQRCEVDGFKYLLVQLLRFSAVKCQAQQDEGIG